MNFVGAADDHPARVVDQDIEPEFAALRTHFHRQRVIQIPEQPANGIERVRAVAFDAMQQPQIACVAGANRKRLRADLAKVGFPGIALGDEAFAGRDLSEDQRIQQGTDGFAVQAFQNVDVAEKA